MATYAYDGITGSPNLAYRYKSEDVVTEVGSTTMAEWPAAFAWSGAGSTGGGLTEIVPAHASNYVKIAGVPGFTALAAGLSESTTGLDMTMPSYAGGMSGKSYYVVHSHFRIRDNFFGFCFGPNDDYGPNTNNGAFFNNTFGNGASRTISPSSTSLGIYHVIINSTTEVGISIEPDRTDILPFTVAQLTTESTVFRISANANGVVFLYEILIYDTIHTQLERDAIIQGLNQKYGVGLMTSQALVTLATGGVTTPNVAGVDVLTSLKASGIGMTVEQTSGVLSFPLGGIVYYGTGYTTEILIPAGTTITPKSTTEVIAGTLPIDALSPVSTVPTGLYPAQPFTYSKLTVNGQIAIFDADPSALVEFAGAGTTVEITGEQMVIDTSTNIITIPSNGNYSVNGGAQVSIPPSKFVAVLVELQTITIEGGLYVLPKAPNGDDLAAGVISVPANLTNDVTGASGVYHTSSPFEIIADPLTDPFRINGPGMIVDPITGIITLPYGGKDSIGALTVFAPGSVIAPTSPVTVIGSNPIALDPEPTPVDVTTGGFSDPENATVDGFGFFTATGFGMTLGITLGKLTFPMGGKIVNGLSTVYIPPGSIITPKTNVTVSILADPVPDNTNIGGIAIEAGGTYPSNPVGYSRITVDGEISIFSTDPSTPDLSGTATIIEITGNDMFITPDTNIITFLANGEYKVDGGPSTVTIGSDKFIVALGEGTIITVSAGIYTLPKVAPNGAFAVSGARTVEDDSVNNATGASGIHHTSLPFVKPAYEITSAFSINGPGMIVDPTTGIITLPYGGRDSIGALTVFAPGSVIAPTAPVTHAGGPIALDPEPAPVTATTGGVSTPTNSTVDGFVTFTATGFGMTLNDLNGELTFPMGGKIVGSSTVYIPPGSKVTPKSNVVIESGTPVLPDNTNIGGDAIVAGATYPPDPIDHSRIEIAGKIVIFSADPTTPESVGTGITTIVITGKSMVIDSSNIITVGIEGEYTVDGGTAVALGDDKFVVAPDSGQTITISGGLYVLPTVSPGGANATAETRTITAEPLSNAIVGSGERHASPPFSMTAYALTEEFSINGPGMTVDAVTGVITLPYGGRDTGTALTIFEPGAIITPAEDVTFDSIIVIPIEPTVVTVTTGGTTAPQILAVDTFAEFTATGHGMTLNPTTADLTFPGGGTIEGSGVTVLSVIGILATTVYIPPGTVVTPRSSVVVSASGNAPTNTTVGGPAIDPGTYTNPNATPTPTPDPTPTPTPTTTTTTPDQIPTPTPFPLSDISFDTYYNSFLTGLIVALFTAAGLILFQRVWRFWYR